MVRILVNITMILSFSIDLHAQELPEFFVPVRPVGMGGAFTGVANDESAVWTNPAGISRVRKARSRKGIHLVKFPNLILGLNKDGRTFQESFQANTEQNVEAIVQATEGIEGKPFWARAALFPVMAYDLGQGNPGAIGLFSNSTTKIAVDRDNPDQTRIEGVADVGGVLNFVITNATNRFSVGVQVRPVYRFAYEDTVATSFLLENVSAKKSRLESDSNKSSGVGVDAGLLWTVADFWFPTIGVSALNLPTGCVNDYLNPFTEKRQKICGTAYTGDFGNPEALSRVDPTDIRVGFSIIPRVFRKFAIRFAIDAHHLYVYDGTSYYGLPGADAGKLLHFGAELFFGNPLLISPLSFRLGASQGFVSAGATVNFAYLSLNFATYGRDISTSSSSKEDRRYLVSISGNL